MPKLPAYLLALPRTPYQRTWDLMKALVEMKARQDFPQVLITVEHDPVITKGRRGSDCDILTPPEVLAARGFEVYDVERGGQNTYHGPGQLVAYPVFKLSRIGYRLVELVRALEEALIRASADFGVKAQRQQGHPGVWVGPAKIASLGLAIRKGVSYHGVALNVQPDLGHFRNINPCGLTPEMMTSLARLRGSEPGLEPVRQSLTRHIADIFGLEFSAWSLDEADSALAQFSQNMRP